MRVALIHFRSVRTPGGLESRLANYARFFVSRGDEVFVIHGKGYADLNLPTQVRLVRIPVRWIPKPIRKLWFKYRCQKILEEEKFDFILSLERVPAQILIAPGTHLGFVRAINRTVYLSSDRVNIYLDKHAFRSCKVILAASKMIRQELIDIYKIPHEKIKVLYPPSDPKEFHYSIRKQRELLRRKFGMHDKFTFLFVSGSHSRKGLPLLIEVFRHFESFPIQLFMVGASVKTRLPGNITHLGFVGSMPELYTAADATIHPARYEPYGQVISESLMCGTPVIVSRKTGASELVKKKEGVVVNSFKPEDWVGAIKKFVEHEWQVPENFAERNNLTIEKHMKAMLEAWSEVEGSSPNE